MMVPTQVFRVSMWHAKPLSVQSVCCWNKMIKTLLGRAQSRMGNVWLRRQSTWISWDMGALHPALSKACTALAQAHGDTKVCVIPLLTEE